MNELPYTDNPEILIKEFLRLIEERENRKVKKKRSFSLSKKSRLLVWGKTDGKCHICGQKVHLNNFEADHVKNHSSGGRDLVENFLASCKTCNSYRWNYSSEEIQWILKIGIWAKTRMAHNDSFGKLLAKEFIKKEIEREKRRIQPRSPMKIK